MSMEELYSYKNGGIGLFDCDVFVVVSEVLKSDMAVEFVVVRAFFEDFVVDSFAECSCDFECSCVFSRIDCDDITWCGKFLFHMFVYVSHIHKCNAFFGWFEQFYK